MSRRMASLYELQTVYSYNDALDLYEILQVNDYNEETIRRAVSRQNGRRA